MATSKKPILKTSNSSATTSNKTQAVTQPNNPNLESFACLWLDQNVNSTDDNRETQQQLRQVINHLQTFGDSYQCEEYIKQIKQEKIVLIVSGSLGREVVPRLHSLSQLSACYVFCGNKEANEKWANKYHKVIHVCLPYISKTYL